jgi:hypothetical protein
VSTPDLPTIIEQYRLGLDAELALLQRLQKIADRQRETSAAQEIDAVQRAADERETLMSGLMAVEQQIRGSREELMRAGDEVRRLPGFSHVVALHETVAGIVKGILETDGDSIRALEQIVEARRIAVQVAEQGESTLAAYGRVIAFPPAATLVDRRG